jgi:hypothetical protein
MDLSGKGGAPGYDVKFDATYRRTDTRSQGSTGWEVRMAPVTGFASPLLGLPTRTPASEMGTVRLLFGNTGTLTKVVGLRAEDLGYNAFLPRVNFAPLLDLLVGTRPAPDADHWSYQGELSLEGWGHFSVDISGKRGGTAHVAGRDCRVLETTLKLPCGAMFAAIGTSIGRQISAEGTETVKAHISVDNRTGEIVSANGTFEGEDIIHHPPPAARNARIAVKGTFEAKLLPAATASGRQHAR